MCLQEANNHLLHVSTGNGWWYFWRSTCILIYRSMDARRDSYEMLAIAHFVTFTNAINYEIFFLIVSCGKRTWISCELVCGQRMHLSKFAAIILLRMQWELSPLLVQSLNDEVQKGSKSRQSPSISLVWFLEHKNHLRIFCSYSWVYEQPSLKICCTK